MSDYFYSLESSMLRYYYGLFEEGLPVFFKEQLQEMADENNQ